MSAGFFRLLRQPQLLFDEGADLDSLIQLIDPPEVAILHLLVYLTLQELAPGPHDLGLTVPSFLAPYLYHNRIWLQRAPSELSCIFTPTFLYQRLRLILHSFGVSWQRKVRIPTIHLALISPKLFIYNASVPTGLTDLDNLPTQSSNIWRRDREAQPHQEDRPGSSDAERGDLVPSERHETADRDRHDHHEDLPHHALRCAQNLKQQADYPRQNPSFLSLPYRDPPRTPRPSASPPAQAPPEAAKELAAPSLRATSGSPFDLSDGLSDASDLSCDRRARSDPRARTRPHDTATVVAQCNISASSELDGGLAPAAASRSCGSNLSVPLSPQLLKNASFVVAAPGEQSRGKAPDRTVPRSSARSSRTHGKDRVNKNTPSRRSGGDESDNDQNDDGEQERDQDAQEGGPRKKRKTLPTLPFRCPKWAADRDGCDPRCEEWHNHDIASVTRHAKKDAKDTPDKLARIELLSSNKFSSLERWQEYYTIFGGGMEDLQRSQPYFVKSDTRNLSQTVLQAWNTNTHLEPRYGDERSLALIAEVERLQHEKSQRDRAIELNKQELINAVQRRANADLKDSDDRFRRDLDAVIETLPGNQQASNRLPEPRRRVPNAMALQTTLENDIRHAGGAATAPTPNVQDLHDLTEPQDQEAWKVPEVPPVYSSINRSDSVGTYGGFIRKPMAEYLAVEEVKAMNSNPTQPQPTVSPPIQHEGHLQIETFNSIGPARQQPNSDPGYYSVTMPPTGVSESSHAIGDVLTQEMRSESDLDMSGMPVLFGEVWPFFGFHEN